MADDDTSEPALPTEWKALLLHLAAKYGLPTVLAVGITWFVISEGRSLVNQLTEDLRVEQQFTREKLIDISERAIKGDATVTEAIRSNTEQAKEVEETIQSNTRVMQKVITKLEPDP